MNKAEMLNELQRIFTTAKEQEHNARQYGSSERIALALQVQATCIHAMLKAEENN